LPNYVVDISFAIIDVAALAVTVHETALCVAVFCVTAADVAVTAVVVVIAAADVVCCFCLYSC